MPCSATPAPWAGRHRFEAGDEPLQERPVRVVGEGQEPGLRAALVLPHLHYGLHLKQGLAALISHGDDEVGYFLK
jgi:hypothetical protein